LLTKTARSCSRTAYVLNRGVARTKLFEKAGNYEAFERVLAETFQQAVMRISSYCVSRGMQDRPSGSGPTFFGGDKVGYLERDALRAGSVVRAEQWRWSSLLGPIGAVSTRSSLASWPVEMPTGWIERRRRRRQAARKRRRQREAVVSIAS